MGVLPDGLSLKQLCSFWPGLSSGLTVQRVLIGLAGLIIMSAGNAVTLTLTPLILCRESAIAKQA
jgi:hypothetical protein